MAHKLVVYLGAKEVSDFVRRAFGRALSAKGMLAWYPGDVFQLERYEQRAEAMPLVDSLSIEVHYSGDDQRQVRYQTDLFLAHIAPLTETVRSLESYARLLAGDADPFGWAQDHAALRIAGICYLARRLDRAMPVLPAFAERQFSANCSDQVDVVSMQDYVRFLYQQPLEEVE